MELLSPVRTGSGWLPLLAVCGALVVGPATGRAQSVSFSQAAFAPLAVGGRATTPVIAEVNGDGRPDIVVALESDHAVAVLLGRPQGGFQPAPGSPFPAGNLPFSLAVADLDGDRKLDVVTVNRTDNQLTVLRGDGLGGFSPLGNPIPTGDEPRTVRIADFNRDGKPDLAVANYEAQAVSILLGDGSGAFTSAAGSPVAVGRNPWGLTVADFNGDSAPDFAVANRTDNSVSVLLNEGSGRFVPAGPPLSVGTQPFDVASADLNHDGKIDLVTADTWSHSVTSLLGGGLGQFAPPNAQPTPVGGIVGGSYPRMVATADVDLDGVPDLVTASEDSSLILLHGNGDGTFRQFLSPRLPQPGIVNSVAAGDLNGDGAPDLVGCGPDFGLTIWLNTAVSPAIEVGAPSALESDLVAKVTLRRTNNVAEPLSFFVSTRDDTAKAGRDYTAVQTRVTFAPNQSEVVLNVPLINDDFGARARQFVLEFSEPDPRVNLPWPAPVQVRDDDEPVRVQARVEGSGLQTDPGTGNPVFAEGSGPIRFIAQRIGSVNSTNRFQVRYRVAGLATSREILFGLDSVAAVPGKDFVVAAAEGTFEFGPGVTERSVEVSLPNDTEPQGYRGVAFTLSYEGIAEGGRDEVVAFIRDDERGLLRQQVVLEPYLPAPVGSWQDWRVSRIHELAGGKTLVVRDMDAVLRLTSEALPDPTFGRGTGRAILPSPVPPHDFDENLRFDRELADGRLQLRWLPDTLVRLTANGVPDPSFGAGTGQLIVPGSLQDTMPDGGLLLLSEDGRHLKRLRSDGSVDPGFSSAWTAMNGFYWARMSPQGQIWAEVDGGLHLFHGTGEPVQNFTTRPGVGLFSGPNTPARVQELHAYFDREGRTYFQVWDSDAFGDPTQGMIVRFLPDGTYDADYRPTPRGVFAQLGEVSPDGTALAIVGGSKLVELDALGRSRPLFHDVNRNIGGARWRSDGTVLLAFRQCGGWNMPLGCWLSGLGILTPEGQLIPIEGRADRQTSANGSIPWDALFPGKADNQDSRLFRSTLRLGHSIVGTTHSGRYGLESSASVGLQRSGSTAVAARVRGRTFPLVAGQWDALSAQPFEVEFPVGQAEAELALPDLAEAGRQPLREYLVHLESATGVELSDFTACRLWVLDDEVLPAPGGLALERFGGADEQNSALLLGPLQLGPWDPGKVHRQEFRSRLELPWEGWEISDPPGFSALGPAWLRPVPMDGTSSGFFRMWAP
jgi:hypothetical protein